MILSLNWLKDMVDLDGISTEEIIKKITLSTAEVEGVEHKGADMDDVVVARIEKCENVPGTHLFLMSVNDGTPERIQIATSAQNVYQGMETALVRVGGMVAGHKIKKAKLAGIDSYGMCCSEAELGIGSDDEGLVDFTGKGFTIGANLKDIMPIEDTLIEIDNKSLTNRPDLWGHLGFARELACIFNRKLKTIDLVDLSSLEGLPNLSIKVETEGCLRYSALRVENVTKKVSPYVVKIRLNYCGLRDINLIADLTNYIMLELGQPMHSFDSSIVNGIIVREAKQGEKLLTLEGEEHEIASGSMLICDAGNEPVAIAGIKGGKKSGISEQTTGFLLEGAVFEASKIRKASKAIGLTTDASIRYEKSLDPMMTDIAIARLVSILKDIDNGIIISSSLGDCVNYDNKQVKIDISTAFIRKRIGAEISNDFIYNTLLGLGFRLENVEGDNLTVVVPSYRATKDISLKEDIVEEIARIYGYDNIVPTTLEWGLTPVEQDNKHLMEYKTKRLLAEKYGVSEVHSYVWNYTDFNTSVGINSPSFVNLVDSSNSGQSGIRSALIPTLIKMYSENKNSYNDIKIEEIGRVVTGLREDKSSIEEKHLAILIASEDKTEVELYFELKKMITNIASSLARVKVDYADTNNSLFMPAMRTAIVVNGESVGEMGVIHPMIFSKIDQKKKVASLEVDFNKFMQFTEEDKKFKKVSKYQSVDIDFNFLVPEAINFAQIEAIIKEFRCKFNMEYKLVDVYENTELFGNNKSMTFRFLIDSSDHTLSSNEIENFRSRLISHMKQKGIELR